MAGGEEKLLQKNLLALYEIIAKKQLPNHLFPSKMHLPCIHEQQMLYSAIIAKDHMKGSSSLYEFLLMTDDENLYTSSNAFLNLHDS